MFSRRAAVIAVVSVLAGVIFFRSNVQAQFSSPSGIITTVAGGGVGDGLSATDVRLFFQEGANIAVDASGNLFIPDVNHRRIRKVAPDGTISTVAGNGVRGFGGDGGPATDAQLNQPFGVAVDTAGNLFIADKGDSRIRKVAPDGTISTVAGTGVASFGGDGGPAIDARLRNPRDVAVDAFGNLFIADSSNRRIRKVAPDGTISTVAGTSSGLDLPYGVAVDPSGNLFIVDVNASRVFKLAPDDTFSTVAGTGEAAFGGDGGPATSALLRFPQGVAVDASGNLYIGDTGNERVRKVAPDGTISTVAGTGTRGFNGDGGPATDALLNFPTGLDVDTSGNLFTTDSTKRIRKVAPDGTISTVAGNGSTSTGSFSGDGGRATDAGLNRPRRVAVDASGNLFIADTGNDRIRKIAPDGTISTVAGSGLRGSSGDGGPATDAGLFLLNGGDIAVDASGNLFIADSRNHRIRRVIPDGTISTIAGNGTEGFGGDGGPATDAQLSFPYGVAVDASGNLFIADSGNNRMRKVAPDGTISTVAGNGSAGFSGDGGPATSAQLSPTDVAVDTSGNLFIVDSLVVLTADPGNSRIRKVALDGTISTVAGNGTEGFSGDGGPATDAQLFRPDGVAVDAAGNLFVADNGNHRIRKVAPDGTISTVAGNGELGTSGEGDGGPATDAPIRSMSGVAVDTAGNLFIAVWASDRIRRVSSTVASVDFTITDRGGGSITTSGSAGEVRVGYGRIQAEGGSTTPSGLALFGLTQNGVLVTEASVPAAAPIQEGRIFAEVNGPVNTGLAIANPNDVDATLTFFFTDVNGVDFGSGSFTLGANQQTAKFLDQDPFNPGTTVLGTFTFASSVPIAVVALRGLTNERDEFLITTLPVAPLSSTSTDTIYFPHFADGDGWTTQVVFVNPTDSTISGNIEFFGQGSGTTAASPVTLALVGRSVESSYSYSISPRSSQRFTTSNPAGAVSVGSVRVTPDVGTTSPSGLGIFSFTTGGITVSEAGVPALPEASAFRVYVEASGTPGAIGSIRSGLAITNTEAGSTNTVTLELTDLDGATVGAAESLTIPPSGQIAQFFDEFFTLPSNFSGVLRVTSTSDVAIVGLRARVNQRGDFMITTTPPSNEAAAPTTVDRYFPHLTDSGGWSTQFVLFSGTAGQSSAGGLSFIDQAGEALNLGLEQ